MTKILVVDDDPGHCSLLQRYLNEQGFSVTTAGDGTQMDRLLQKESPDLIILDLMLPGEDGFSIARRLGSSIPIIMLSARGDDVDRIVGLELGADDYLPKPFNPRELLARIRAVLRRDGAASSVPVKQSAAHDIITFSDFTLDLSTHRLSRLEENISLTSSEFTLLKIFTQHPDRVLSRDQLIDMLKGYERHPYDRSIDVRVARLRRKIENDPSNPRFIVTIWGEGYLFSPQENQQTG